ncbi:MAG: Bug family tripartite tricarboxylate transporter substrate binding protein [Pseudorhizobium sp.]
MIKRRMFSVLLACTLIVPSAFAQTAEEFFADKTLRVVSSTGAGGTMDLYLLLFMKYAAKHLPEGTEMVLEHRTGGGGAIMANYLYNQAPADGTTFGMPVPAVVSSTFSTPEATRYKPDKFSAIGRIVDNPRVFVARKEAGVENLQDAAKIEIEITHSIMTIGTSLDQFMTVANDALGTKFKHVAGYSGGGPAFLAMEQGEVMSTTAEPANLLANKWHLVESGEIKVLGHLGLEPIEGLEDVPNLLDLVEPSNPAYGQVQAVAQSAGIGLGLLAPPGVPDDRIAYLRDVFTKTMTDPELLAEAKERKIPLNYESGEWLQNLLKESMTVDDSVKQWFKSLVTVQ